MEKAHQDIPWVPHAEISPEPCGPGVQRRVLAYSKDAMGVGVTVHGTHAAGLKGVFHTHGVPAVGQNAALHPGAAGFRGNVGVGHPWHVLMVFLHYNISSFPIQMQKGTVAQRV